MRFKDYKIIQELSDCKLVELKFESKYVKYTGITVTVWIDSDKMEIGGEWLFVDDDHLAPLLLNALHLLMTGVGYRF